MKKFFAILLGCTLSLGLMSSASALTIHRPSDWKPNGEQGEVTIVDDNTVTLKGALNYGPFSKASVQKLSDGITEETYVDLNSTDINDGGFFEVSLALKDADNNYVTEAVVMTTRHGDSYVLTAGWAPNFNIEAIGDGIYTYQWHMFIKDDGIAYVNFTLKNGETVVGSTGDISLDSESIKTKDTKNPVAAQKDVSVKYLWFCNIQTKDGAGTVKVYSKLPGAENAEVVAPATDSNLSFTDTDKLADVLKKALAKLELDGLNEGTAVEFEFESTDAAPTEEEASSFKDVLIKEAPKGVIAKYLEISIAVKDSMTDKELGKISELDEEIELSVNLPTDLPEVAEGYQRIYYILREHNGEVTVLPTTISEDGKTLSFASDQFSIYALAYEDVAEASNPNTLDKAPVYLAIATVTLTGLTALGYSIKKKLED